MCSLRNFCCRKSNVELSTLFCRVKIVERKQQTPHTQSIINATGNVCNAMHAADATNGMHQTNAMHTMQCNERFGQDLCHWVCSLLHICLCIFLSCLNSWCKQCNDQNVRIHTLSFALHCSDESHLLHLLHCLGSIRFVRCIHDVSMDQKPCLLRPTVTWLFVNSADCGKSVKRNLQTFRSRNSVKYTNHQPAVKMLGTCPTPPRGGCPLVHHTR